MSENKHTPGPWEVFIDDTGGQWSGWPLSIGPCDNEEKSIVRPGGFYPYKWDEHTSKVEAIANAHLVAAAPDLFDALETLLATMERVNRTHPHGAPGSPVRMNQEARIAAEDKAHAAISKALTPPPTTRG